MAFNSVNRQFPALDQFAAYLATLPSPDWPGANPVGSTYHNSYIPNITQWRGLASMRSMQATYEAKGWTAGPHLFLARGAPNAAHDGVFVMTPPTSPGVHSPSCNGARFGVELVGDFQNNAPTVAQQQLLIDTLVLLHRWARLGPNLNAHRDCDPRTCPGDAFYAIKTSLQTRFAAALATDPWAAWGPIDAPDAVSRRFAIPQAWLKNRAMLGACLRGERYDLPDRVSRALFQGGELRYFGPTGVVELLKYPQPLEAL